jgi:hypothetical protein
MSKTIVGFLLFGALVTMGSGCTQAQKCGSWENGEEHGDCPESEECVCEFTSFLGLSDEECYCEPKAGYLEPEFKAVGEFCSGHYDCEYQCAPVQPKVCLPAPADASP